MFYVLLFKFILWVSFLLPYYHLIPDIYTYAPFWFCSFDQLTKTTSHRQQVSIFFHEESNYFFNRSVVMTIFLIPVVSFRGKIIKKINDFFFVNHFFKAKNQSIVFLRPLSKEVIARNPNSVSARDTSRRLLG